MTNQPLSSWHFCYATKAETPPEGAECLLVIDVSRTQSCDHCCAGVPTYGWRGEKGTDELETKKSHTGLDEILHDWNPRAWEVEARG